MTGYHIPWTCPNCSIKGQLRCEPDTVHEVTHARCTACGHVEPLSGSQRQQLLAQASPHEPRQRRTPNPTPARNPG